MVDTDAFEVGEDIAVTPGAVVLRTAVFELIQYTPQTAEGARACRCCIVPPTINKYYVVDLAPGAQHGRAPGRAAASRCSRSPGATPTRGHADWGLDTYAQAVLEALDAVEEITRRRTRPT